MQTKVVLFDLGGVLIELSGLPTMANWTRLSEPEIWQKWFSSPAVRRFESGRGSAEQFADELVRELQIDASAAEFLQHFTSWPRGVFAGGIELLEQLREHLTIACLSNTNHLHWQRFKDETPLLELFHATLASHQTGLMKPDPESFEHAIDFLAEPAASILFLDDNQINIDAARRAGMRAELTRGVAEALAHVKQHQLI